MMDIRENIECFYLLIDHLREAMSDIKSEKTKIILSHFITFIDYSTMDISLNNLNRM